MRDESGLDHARFEGCDPQVASIPRKAVSSEAFTAHTRQNLKAIPAVYLKESSCLHDSRDAVERPQPAL